MKHVARVLVVVFAVGLPMFVLSGCSGETEKTVIQYMPHMHNTPVQKPQRGYEFGNGKGSSALVPPAGTVPRGFFPYQMETAEEAGKKLNNPLPFTAEVIARGREKYQIYCYVCHGSRGIGDGPVVPPYPIPKSLVSEQAREYADGHIFHVITKGQGVMPSYASQVPVEDRWAIVHFVRVLQRAENPTKQDLEILEQRKAK